MPYIFPQLPPNSIRICADRGGTFTDVWASYPDVENIDGPRKEMVVKLLSVDPRNYPDATTEGVRRILATLTGKETARGEKLSDEFIDYIRLSTTVATNALLTRRGKRHALVITKGFGDALEIGNQSRPKIFDLNIQRPSQLYEKVLEVDERVTLVGYSTDPENASRQPQFDSEGKVTRAYQELGEIEGQRNPTYPAAGEPGSIVRGLSGEAVHVLKKPSLEKLKVQLTKLVEEDGYDTCAIVFLHSYTYPQHEKVVAALATECGFKNICQSHEVGGMIKLVPRGTSTTADAYLTPILLQYLQGLFAGFTKGIENKVEFMTSNGGLVPLSSFNGLKSLLSGPAGGVVGFSRTGYDEIDQRPIIGLDIGGTSTDVSRYAGGGRFEQVLETTTAGIQIQSPQLDINTVAAGGGSCLGFRDGLFLAGPDSATADPGPVCYRKGGPLAITDANLFLGRIDLDSFPSCFGPTESDPLDPEATKLAFEKIVTRIRKETGTEKSIDELVYGWCETANETMARPIRALTEARGFDLTKHILSSFGGAGGQHCCDIATILRIKTILIHKFSSILSAYGLALADRVEESQEPAADFYNEQTTLSLNARLDQVEGRVVKRLMDQGFPRERIHIERMLNMRYTGTDTSLMSIQSGEASDFEGEFKRMYREEFGFILEGNTIEVDDIRVRGTGKSYDTLPKTALAEQRELDFVTTSATPEKVSSVYFKGGRRQTPVYMLDCLKTGTKLVGPAMILDKTQTIVVTPGAELMVTSNALIIELP